MSYKPCGHECEGCEVQRTTKHHIFKQEIGRTLGGIALEFCRLPINVVQICEPMHHTLEAEYGWPDYPTVGVMKAAIEATKSRSQTMMPPE
jgi:hypothetical protein